MSSTENTKRPIIGITGNFGEKGCEVAEAYYRSVLEAGGVPYIIPPHRDMGALHRIMSVVSGVILSGGGDISPMMMGLDDIPEVSGVCPTRDDMEISIVNVAYKKNIPILGICRGMQVMAVALGGSIYQDLGREYTASPLVGHSQDTPRDCPSHEVDLARKSLLAYIYKTKEGPLAVNSFHHQAVKSPGPHLRAVAWARDGVIEGVESTEFRSILGVQWHPECLGGNMSRRVKPLFGWIVKEAALYAEARNTHRRRFCIDMHCDTAMHFAEGYTPQMFAQDTEGVQVDIPKMYDGGLTAAVMAAYIPQGPRDEESLRAATAKAEGILAGIEEMASANSEKLKLIHTTHDLFSTKDDSVPGIMLGIENGYAIGRDISLVEKFRRRGVVYMTLCHNGDNDICGSACGEGEHGGVTEFGEEVIKEMNRVGMMIDLSHASEYAFYDALNISRDPVICTHSNARALCDHPRNLTDEQLYALADVGGLVGLNFYSGFLRSAGEATILDALAHLDHMISIVGVEHVGIGTDFDGGGGIPGMSSAADALNFTLHMMGRRYSGKDLKRIWGDNFIKLFKQFDKRFKLLDKQAGAVKEGQQTSDESWED